MTLPIFEVYILDMYSFQFNKFQSEMCILICFCVLLFGRNVWRKSKSKQKGSSQAPFVIINIYYTMFLCFTDLLKMIISKLKYILKCLLNRPFLKIIVEILHFNPSFKLDKNIYTIQYSTNRFQTKWKVFLYLSFDYGLI